ncbi:hypothetical protein BV25DRAFT_291133 [Artomyces pyxidatus]|uniref:Uncharacterized protein n=1 Tax=Artomyces pyxidatus TaxID=48021 RepID=A0ACB8SGD9_9AGAM|nr:hypothetical protein BV25DRAFT_291133 [Artomyces pyxidatus]
MEQFGTNGSKVARTSTKRPIKNMRRHATPLPSPILACAAPSTDLRRATRQCHLRLELAEHLRALHNDATSPVDPGNTGATEQTERAAGHLRTNSRSADALVDFNQEFRVHRHDELSAIATGESHTTAAHRGTAPWSSLARGALLRSCPRLWRVAEGPMLGCRRLSSGRQVDGQREDAPCTLSAVFVEDEGVGGDSGRPGGRCGLQWAWRAVRLDRQPRMSVATLILPPRARTSWQSSESSSVASWRVARSRTEFTACPCRVATIPAIRLVTV